MSRRREPREKASLSLTRMSAVYDCSDPHARADGLKAAVSAVRSGRLVVLPTDTVYGIGADAFDSDGRAALCSGQEARPRHAGGGPGRLLVHRRRLGLAVPSRGARTDRGVLARRFRSRVRQAPSLQWDLGTTPRHRDAADAVAPGGLEVLREVGPMAVSSANISGQPPAVPTQEAREQSGSGRGVSRRRPGDPGRRRSSTSPGRSRHVASGAGQRGACRSVLGMEIGRAQDLIGSR